MRWALHSKLPVLASLAVHFRRRMLVNNKQLTASFTVVSRCLSDSRQRHQIKSKSLFGKTYWRLSTISPIPEIVFMFIPLDE
ncbi:unnamed protein product, partial [Trichobilharzia szidati]